MWVYQKCEIKIDSISTKNQHVFKKKKTLLFADVTNQGCVGRENGINQ